jgi:hypothetical protein
LNHRENSAGKKSTLVSLFFVAVLFTFINAKAEPTKSTTASKSKISTQEELKAYKSHAVPFMKQYCFKCHDNNKQKGKLNLEELGLNMKSSVVGEMWNNIYAQVQFEEMPPSKSKQQPSAAEKEKFLKWLDTELIRHGRGFGLDEKLLLPEFGNYIDHQTLFDGSVKEMPYTPSRIWRQRPSIYSSLWGKPFGTVSRFSVRIGGIGNETIKRGPHKGKKVAARYFDNARFANPFYEFVHHAAGFSDYASIVADQASLETLLINAETMAEILTKGRQVSFELTIRNKDSKFANEPGQFTGGQTSSMLQYRGRIPSIFKKIVNNQGTVSRADFNEALNVTFALFYKRKPTTEENEYYWTAVFQKNVPLDNETALQAILIYITLSPEFVYRMEMGMGEKDQHGRRILSSQELVYAIHHAFDNNPAFGVVDFKTEDVYTRDTDPELVKKRMMSPRPSWESRDNWLVSQMKAGKLKTKKDIEAAVRSYLRDLRSPRIKQFFREYFGYHKAPDVFKDTEKFAKLAGFKQFSAKGRTTTAEQFVLDTDILIDNVLKEDKNILYELLTTNKIYIAHWRGVIDKREAKKLGKEEYAQTHHLQNYNLNPYDHQHKSDYRGKKVAKTVPKEQRCGVLTQPSWLVAHSGNFENDPVRRGKWIREKLLAGVVMDVPIGVDAKIPDNEHQTLRQRFSVVEEDECWRCHKKMNPLGMPFEAYNHVGRWRATEKNKPTNTLGEISHTVDKNIHTEVKTARQMMEKIATSDLARQSFLRHVFRYWMGRNEMLSDSKTLIEMDKVYIKSGGSFRETLVALLTSDSFLYRK